eukprot:TRINITY_DN664_c0_g1_i1.p1 TRINITY_DN664_c0_g1~~TRINITY_DN664_c0_g1_i1.p1  ORF type:complete len:1450 (+),score=406.51 TRINITY_DN664_c0_g1_i1:84-4352(+)
MPPDRGRPRRAAAAAAAAVAAAATAAAASPAPPPFGAPDGNLSSGSPGAAPGVCCSLCKMKVVAGDCAAAGGCLGGCWKPNSFCSWDQTRCNSQCKATWCTPPPADPGRPPPPPPPVSTAPRAVLWNRTGAGPRPSISIQGGDLYLSPSDVMLSDTALLPKVHKWALADGRQRWARTLPVATSQLQAMQVQPAVIADGSAYVLTARWPIGPNIAALDAATGALRWEVNSTQTLVPTPLTAGAGSVFFLNVTGWLTALHAANGTARWSFRVGSWDGGWDWAWTGPQLVGGRIFKPGQLQGDNYLFALDPLTGAEQWAMQCPTAAWQPSVAVGGGYAFIATTYYYHRVLGYSLPLGEPDGRIQGFDATGWDIPRNPQWNIDLPAALGQPVVWTEPDSGAVVVVFSACSRPPSEWFFWFPTRQALWTNCTVWAVDAAAAAQDTAAAVLWRHQFDELVAVSSITVASGAVFVSGSVFTEGSIPFPVNCSVSPTANSSSPLPDPNCTYPDWWPAECRPVNHTLPEECPWFACNGTFPDGLPNCTVHIPLPNLTLPGYQEPFLMALSAASGRQLWRQVVDHSNSAFHFIEPARNDFYGVNADGTVLVFGLNETVIALDVSLREPRSVQGRLAFILCSAAAALMCIAAGLAYLRSACGAREPDPAAEKARLLGPEGGGSDSESESSPNAPPAPPAALVAPAEQTAPIAAGGVRNPPGSGGSGGKAAATVAAAVEPRRISIPKCGEIVDSVSFPVAEPPKRQMLIAVGRTPGKVMVQLDGWGGAEVSSVRAACVDGRLRLRAGQLPWVPLPEDGVLLSRVRAVTRRSGASCDIPDSISLSGVPPKPRSPPREDQLVPEGEAQTLWQLRQYELLKELGRGGFGRVFLARWKGELVALKRVTCGNDRELRVALHEVRLLRALPAHPGLICVREAFSLRDCVYIAMHYHQQGDLADYISGYPAEVVAESEVLGCVAQLCAVLHHLHSLQPQVVHRDLKPANILVEQDPSGVHRFVVTDFGLARLVDKTYMNTHAGTMAFMAPEAFDGPYDTKVDIWSLGCIVYGTAMRRVRNCRVMCVHVGRKGFHQEISAAVRERGYSWLVVDLVRQMLQFSPNARPCAEEVLHRLHPDAPPSLRLGDPAVAIPSPPLSASPSPVASPPSDVCPSPPPRPCERRGSRSGSSGSRRAPPRERAACVIPAPSAAVVSGINDPDVPPSPPRGEGAAAGIAAVPLGLLRGIAPPQCAAAPPVGVLRGMTRCPRRGPASLPSSSPSSAPATPPDACPIPVRAPAALPALLPAAADTLHPTVAAPASPEDAQWRAPSPAEAEAISALPLGLLRGIRPRSGAPPPGFGSSQGSSSSDGGGIEASPERIPCSSVSSTLPPPAPSPPPAPAEQHADRGTRPYWAPADFGARVPPAAALAERPRLVAIRDSG